MPKVSVCIPVYNPGAFLSLAIDSVLAQTLTDFELVIVDDASTQPVEAMVVRYCDSRIRFEKNVRNLGLVGNWNRCIALAKGQYVTIFHQDDLMTPENVARKVVLLDTHPNIGFVYSNVARVGVSGDRLGCYPIQQPQSDLILSGQQLFEMVARVGNPIPCPTVMARSECFRRLGGFDPRLPFATDLEMWLRLAAHYDIGYIATELISLRVHSDQETARFVSNGRDYRDVLKALNVVFSGDLPSECAQYASQSYRTLASQSLGMSRWRFRQGNIQLGLSYFGVALMSAVRAALASALPAPHATAVDDL